MGCHFIKNGIICCPNIYVYKGFTFEFHDYLGPTEWTQLTDKQKKKTKVYG